MISVEEFKDRWIRNNRPIRVPFKDAIHVTDIAYALCLYREENYQVELYICKANTQSPPHSHPGIESISMYLTGDITFKKSDGDFADLSEYQKPNEDGTHMLLGVINETNDGKNEHAIKIGAAGGSFLLFEKWNEEKPSSVAIVYEGESMGEIHDKIKRKKNVE